MNVACETAPKFLPVEMLSFDQIPNQSRLFLDYLKNPSALRHFYPSAMESHCGLSARVSEVLENHRTDRNRLADALARMNKGWNASAQTLENIERLRDSDSVAVVTGQQAGIFTGSLYTIYKAFSVIKTAACLSGRGIKAVPVFWIASEDHDFAEVASTTILNRGGGLTEIKIPAIAQNENLPVGNVRLDESINEAIEKLFAELPRTEFSEKLQTAVREAYQPGATLSEAFARLMSRLFASFGLVLLDPLDEELKKLAAPIYAEAIEKSAEITQSLVSRSKELESAGYHAQVLIKEDSFPLFWIDDDGKRCALHREKNGKISTRCQKYGFEIAELKKIAEENPSRFSPNATLRSIVQDFLLPTVGYFGGAAEIAYFAQSSEIYRILQRPVTPIFHRASLTVVEPRERRTLDKYELSVTDFFARHEDWLPRVVENYLNRDAPPVFDEAEEIINAQLDRLDQSLSGIDSTLAKSLARRRPKILHHVAALRTKFHLAEMRKNETVKRQLETACAALYPRKGLQERTLNVASLLDRHGDYFLEWIWQVVNVDSFDHQIVYL